VRSAGSGYQLSGVRRKMVVQRVKYRKELTEGERLQLRKQVKDSTEGLMPSKNPTTKVVKWGKIGAPDSQKRRDYLNSIRKKKRARSKMVKAKIEDDIELVEEAKIELEEDDQVVEKPEPAVIKEKIKEPGPIVEKNYIDYPY
jgi:hypothetical protein